MSQLSLFPETETKYDNEKTTTFEDNMKLPIHRWYRYTAGFSASWVAKVIEEELLRGRKHVIDPFVGSGTVAIECTKHSVEAYGLESNPYVFKIASAKLRWNQILVDDIQIGATRLLEEAKTLETNLDGYPDLIRRCFPDEVLHRLDSLKKACLNIKDEVMQNFMWFVITSILRSTSPVGTAQWQYVLPNKSKANVVDPYEAFIKKVSDICHDITLMSSGTSSRSARILQQDSRRGADIPDNWGDLVITSPPYANNYDYADAMRLEMSFWGDIDAYNGLKGVSANLVRACTQHVSRLKDEVEEMINSPLLEPIRDELIPKFNSLLEERGKHGGKKTII